MPSKKLPLSVDDLWSIKRIGAPTLSPDGASACASVTSFDMEKNEGSTELWLFPTDGGKARRLTAGDKDSDPHVVARRQVDRLHGEAQGRRGDAGLPHRARRRRGACA